VGRKAKREPRMRAAGLAKTKEESLRSKCWGSSLTAPVPFSLQKKKKEKASAKL